MLINKNEIPSFLKAVLLLYLIIAFNPDIRAHSMIWYSVTVVTSLLIFAYLALIRKLKLNRYIWWLLIFNTWCLISLFWALNQGHTFDSLKTALAQMIILMPLSMLIRSKEDLYEILKIVVIAILITSVYLLINIDRSTIGQTRITDEGWNANSIGMMTAVATLLCFGIIKDGVSKPRLIFYLAAILFMGYICLFTGSRKSLFILVAGISLYYLFTGKNNKVLVLSGITGFIFLSYYLIMSVPELYNVMGIRVEGLLAQFTGEGVADSSTRTRMLMMDLGIDWFKQSPLTGYGLNNYRTLLAWAIGRSTYAHNNYVELLVGVGAIGTVIYYYIYAHIIKRLFKAARKKEATAALFFALIIILVIIEYGLVSYNGSLMQLAVCLGYAATNVKEGALTQESKAPIPSTSLSHPL